MNNIILFKLSFFYCVVNTENILKNTTQSDIVQEIVDEKLRLISLIILERCNV